MRIPRIYIETTVFNACFDVDAPENIRTAWELFAAVERGNYVPFTSEYAVAELLKAYEEKRMKMLALVEKYDIQIIKNSEEAVELANTYVEQGIIPEKYTTDGLHIAVASIHNLDVIFSYNFKHIVKEKTRILTKIVNEERGYKGSIISSPREGF